MSFRSKRTFGDIHGIENISESRVELREPPKSPKLSSKVSNKWGPFSPPTLKASKSSEVMTSQPSIPQITLSKPSHPPKSQVAAYQQTMGDTVLPQSSCKAPQESRINSHVRKITTSWVHSPPSTSPAQQSMSTSPPSINLSPAQQSMSSSYVRKTTTSRVHSPSSLNLSPPPPSPTQGMPTNHDENKRSH
ncbi:unnamed protein product [Amaranthus hypochondriacus]